MVAGRIGDEGADVCPEVAENFAGQRVDESARRARSLAAQAVQAGARLGERELAVNGRQRGFVGIGKVAARVDRVFDQRGEIRAERGVAGDEVEKIERQPVVHRGEKMGLPQFHAGVPQCAADDRRQPAVVPRRQAEHGRGAIADDRDFGRGVRLARQPHEMLAKADGVQAVGAAEKILADVADDRDFLRAVTRGHERAGAILARVKGGHRLGIELPDIPPAHRVGLRGFPLRAVGAGENEKRPQPRRVAAPAGKLRRALGVIEPGFCEVLESAPVGHEKVREFHRGGREPALRHERRIIVGQRDAGETRGPALMQRAGEVGARDLVAGRQRQPLGFERELDRHALIRIEQRGFDRPLRTAVRGDEVFRSLPRGEQLRALGCVVLESAHLLPLQRAAQGLAFAQHTGVE